MMLQGVRKSGVASDSNVGTFDKKSHHIALHMESEGPCHGLCALPLPTLPSPPLTRGETINASDPAASQRFRCQISRFNKRAKNQHVLT